MKIDIEKLFKEREIALEKKANSGAVTKFYDHFNVKGWMNERKPISDLTPFVDRWINTDHEKRPEKKPMVIKIDEKYRLNPYPINDF